MSKLIPLKQGIFTLQKGKAFQLWNKPYPISKNIIRIGINPFVFLIAGRVFGYRFFKCLFSQVNGNGS